jgi:hypothetical protein
MVAAVCQRLPEPAYDVIQFWSTHFVPDAGA